MPEEVDKAQPPEPSPSEDTVSPEDFREYEKWRKTGELPEKKPPAAAEKAQAPPAKTEPEPGPEDKSEPEEQEEDEEEGEAKPSGKRPGSRQRRIDKLTRELDELRRVIAGQQQQQPAAKPPEKPPPAEGKPKLEDFETLEAYQEALTDFAIDRREKARQQEAQRQAVIQYEERLQADWAIREKNAKKLHPDYLETIESVEMPKGPIVADLRQAILEEEQGAEILYWLAKHPDEIKRIAALSPHSAVREIGKIAARLPNGNSTPSTGSETPKKQVTSATRPPAAVTRSAGAPSEEITDPEVESDYKRWERKRMAQLKEK